MDLFRHAHVSLWFYSSPCRVPRPIVSFATDLSIVHAVGKCYVLCAMCSIVLGCGIYTMMRADARARCASCARSCACACLDLFPLRRTTTDRTASSPCPRFIRHPRPRRSLPTRASARSAPCWNRASVVSQQNDLPTHLELEDPLVLSQTHFVPHGHHDLHAEEARALDHERDLDALVQRATEEGEV
jgi:hypothetical protein